MSLTSTTKPTIDAFKLHLKSCERCKNTMDDWWSISDPTWEQAKSALQLCDEGKKILRAVFN